MAIKLINSTYYVVNVEDITEAAQIVQKVIDGTATPEEAALIIDTGITGLEGDAPA